MSAVSCVRSFVSVKESWHIHISSFINCWNGDIHLLGRMKFHLGCNPNFLKWSFHTFNMPRSSLGCVSSLASEWHYAYPQNDLQIWPRKWRQTYNMLFLHDSLTLTFSGLLSYYLCNLTWGKLFPQISFLDKEWIYFVVCIRVFLLAFVYMYHMYAWYL